MSFYDTLGSSSSISGSQDLREVQSISTILSPGVGASISGGWFRLSLSAHGVNTFDPQTDTLTARIPYDASEADVQAASASGVAVPTRSGAFRSSRMNGQARLSAQPQAFRNPSRSRHSTSG